jgi:hypothetical protein
MAGWQCLVRAGHYGLDASDGLVWATWLVLIMLLLLPRLLQLRAKASCCLSATAGAVPR